MELSEKFIKKSVNIHGDKYSYIDVNYVNNTTKVDIICKKHGLFKQTPTHHLKGSGCQICSNCKKMNTEEFIEKSKKIYGESLYIYDKVRYLNKKSKIIIGCNKHGYYDQLPSSHLNGHICFRCCTENKKSNKFIEKANLIHNNLYEYTDINYINNYTKITIICKKHGNFAQKPNDHFRSYFNSSIKKFEMSQYRDQLKKEYCVNNDIPLLIIKFNENVEDILKNNLIYGR